jgi:hypothetical protein
MVGGETVAAKRWRRDSRGEMSCTASETGHILCVYCSKSLAHIYHLTCLVTAELS